MSEFPLVVVGIGHDGPAGLSAEARAHIDAARILAGGRRQLGYFPHWTKEKLVLDWDVAAFVATIAKRYRQQQTVVLASGDPLFYGIGRALLDALPKDDLFFLPQVSSVQHAFARLKETWQDARVVSVHGRPLDVLIPAIQARDKKIAVLTDAKNNAVAIADLLYQFGAADAYTIWVCENLGGADERVSRFVPADCIERDLSPLNVVVLLRDDTKSVTPTPDLPLLGIPENVMLHRPGPQGMITHREVRLLAICYLELHPEDVLWDVGAGSGSVSLEAARLGAGLQTIAIERDQEAFARLAINVAQLGAGRVRAVLGEAPECLATLPDPNAVFIGGSGGHLAKILQTAIQRLAKGGRIVVNCITLENFSLAWGKLTELGLEPEATAIQLSHARPLGRLHAWEPDKPITIVRARKP